MSSRPSNPQSQGSWLKLTDAAHFLDVSEITLRRRIKAGQIPCEFKNGKYFVYISEETDDESHSVSERENLRPLRSSTLPIKHFAPKFMAESPRPAPRRAMPEPTHSTSHEPHFFEEEFGASRMRPTPRHENRPDNSSLNRNAQPEPSLQIEVQQLRRMIEDQQSLISMLEEAVESLQHQFSVRTKFQ
jgi:hypothetical protein